jgi:hypothetical protein
MLDAIEILPKGTHKIQRNFYKDNKVMERIMEAICVDVKEAKEVKKEADEIIKEIARKAEAHWETEYFEDNNDPWEYKIGYCSMEIGVCIENRWKWIRELGKSAEGMMNAIEVLPTDAHKRQRNFYKDNKIMERIMETICDDVKEAREDKKEANEIIKEIARKAEAPWEKTEYFEDKNDPWEYKIGYCTMENGVCVEYRCWPYRGFTTDWIEDIRMLFWRLEHPDTWWCDFNRVFKEIDEDEEKISKEKDVDKRAREHEAIDIYRKRIGEEFEKDLTEDKDNLEQTKHECREIVQYIHYKVDPSIEYYLEKNRVYIDEDDKYFS